MAQKLFMELDDDLFLYEIGNQKVSKLNNIELFDKLRNEFLIISNIVNYEELEQKLYGNKSRKEIIEFELVRIIDNLNNNEFVTFQLVNIEKLLKMYHGDIPNDVYKRMINLIIKVELMLDVKIGLFKELCELYVFLSNKFKEENNKMGN